MDGKLNIKMSVNLLDLYRNKKELLVTVVDFSSLNKTSREHG